MSSQLPNNTKVFEIAAFRKANPLGKLAFQPLFIERDILAVWLCMYLFTSALLCVIASGVRDGNTPFAFFFSICCLGMLPAVHYVRKGYRDPRACILQHILK